MGFWDSLGESLGKSISKGRDEFNETAKYAERMSDREIMERMTKEQNMAKKMAYAKELKNRGYGPSHDND
ncbi:MAG: hypothetical protein IJM23_05730 [Lachnospiraceae bacterium]|nr:hypothetical protein [Lachnospiraceae bacterium]